MTNPALATFMDRQASMIDDLFPGQVRSYKGHVRQNGLGDTRICYFHGELKPHQIDEPWIREHWLGG
jgi:hypothetical protein